MRRKPKNAELQHVQQRKQHKNENFRTPQRTVTCRFVVVHVDSFQLEVGISVIRSSWIDAVLIRNHLPELKAKIQTNRERFGTKNQELMSAMYTIP